MVFSQDKILVTNDRNCKVSCLACSGVLGGTNVVHLRLDTHCGRYFVEVDWSHG